MIKVLIVDDSIFSQKTTESLLLKNLEDVEIYKASDGQEGFTKYTEILPDYVVLDLLMPKINGLELIKLINEYYGNAKIFVLSADVQKNIREEAEALNIMQFINKPFNQEKAQILCDMIRNGVN
jgi:Response regulator containing CheY-like receiver domain and AraC-type DNA-binding domain